MGYENFIEEYSKKVLKEARDMNGREIKIGDMVDTPIGDGIVIRVDSSGFVDVEFSSGKRQSYPSNKIEVD